MNRSPALRVTNPRVLGALACGALALALQGCDKKLVYVGPDKFLVVIAANGRDLPPGRVLAGPGEKGVRADVLGPGSHELANGERYELHDMIEIRAGRPPAVVDHDLVPEQPPEIGVVTALTGDPLPPGEFIAHEGQRGIQHAVLTPGTYLLNPYAFSVERHPATVIPPGNVGVVTHLSGALTAEEFAGPTERGVQRAVLHSGLYFLNPYEFQVTPVRVGYRELTFADKHAIAFPSSDSNTIIAEVSIIWGLTPEDAPYLLKRFGAEADVVDRVIKPQVESIVRLLGSNYSSRDFVEGDSRAQFQEEVTTRLKNALESKNVRVLLALVRNLEVPESVRKPLQLARLAEEQTLTNVELLETSKALTELQEVKATVGLAAAEVKAETERMVAIEFAQGQAEAARLDAEMSVAWNQQATAILEKKHAAAALLARAEADATRSRAAAEAEGLKAMVDALGGTATYQLWRLADVVPADVQIDLRAQDPLAALLQAGAPQIVIPVGGKAPPQGQGPAEPPGPAKKSP